jgi:hypothetical protein
MVEVVADEIDGLFDEAMEQSKTFEFELQSQPIKEVVSVEDTAENGGPLRLDQQPFRSLDGVRGVFHLFDSGRIPGLWYFRASRLATATHCHST